MILHKRLAEVVDPNTCDCSIQPLMRTFQKKMKEMVRVLAIVEKENERNGGETKIKQGIIERDWK